MPSVKQVGFTRGDILRAMVPVSTIYLLIGLGFLIVAYREAFVYDRSAAPAMMRIEQVPVLEAPSEHPAPNQK